MSTELETTNNNLPALPFDDGWNDTDDTDTRVIHGTLLKCVDGNWSTKDGATIPKQLIALAHTTVLQRWEMSKPVETITKRPGQPWPDIDELNEATNKDDWEIGIDGQPRAPWQKQFVIYFLDPQTMAKFTFANGTTGARIAVSDLKDAIKWMRAAKASDTITPLVELSSKTMKTKFGSKLRPFFKIVEWRDRGSPAAAAPVLEAVKEPTVGETLNDEIPF